MVLTTASAARYRVQELLDLGARQNPRRPFVFVSKVLGKHWPCAPSTMRDVQVALAAELGPEPAMFIGMAETATGLGEGVYSAWCGLHGDTSGLYVATTRYPIEGAEALNFTEAHSHATALNMYLPAGEEARRRLDSVSRLVLVDDEISTGKTFASLVDALRARAGHVRHIDVVALTDFSAGQVVERLRAVPGVERVRVHALVSGSFDFTPSAGDVSSAAPAQREVSCRRSRMMAGTPRLGIIRPLRVPEALVRDISVLLAGRAVRLIATGECMYPAQCLGEQLEAQGCHVILQSTTRSPLMLGGAIASVRQVSDPYGEGVVNYIYNLSDADVAESRRAEHDLPESGRAEQDGAARSSAAALRLIVHETGDNPQIRQLCTELSALAVDIGSGQLLSGPCGQAVA